MSRPEIPFLCQDCDNWYTPLNRQSMPPGSLLDNLGGPDDVCRLSHAAVGKSHSHCHYDDIASTQGEVMVGSIHRLARGAVALNAAALEAIAKAKARENVDKALFDAASAYKLAAESAATLPEAERIAGLFLLPGTDEWKNMEGMIDLTGFGPGRLNRRPVQDLHNMQRSVRIAKALSPQILALIAQAKELFGHIQAAAAQWQAPEPEPVAPVVNVTVQAPPTPSRGTEAQKQARAKSERSEAQKQANRERMARVRAARKQKETVSA